MNVTLRDGTTAHCEDTPFAEGGDGVLYRTRDPHHVIKLYKNPEPWRQQALTAILDKFNVVEQNAYWEQLFAWPNGIVTAPQLGIRMRRVTGQRPLSDFVHHIFRTTRLTAAERGTWRGYVAAAIRVARLVARLHQYGLCHADLSENNIFINPTDGQATLLDCDGLVVPGVIQPSVQGTFRYMAPEVYTNAAPPSILGDRHALAVILYRLLFIHDPFAGPKHHHSDPQQDDFLAYGDKALFIEDPADTSNRPTKPFPSVELLGTPLKKLFQEAFVSGLHTPRLRPAAASWEQALVRLFDQLIPCTNPACDFQAFPLLDGTLACPWCGTPPRATATIPLLHLYKLGAHGSATRDGHYTIAGTPGRTIHTWHIDHGVAPGAKTDDRVLASLDYEQATRTWFLQNHELRDLRIVGHSGSTPLPARQRFALAHGQHIVFGSPERPRVAYVQLRQY